MVAGARSGDSPDTGRTGNRLRARSARLGKGYLTGKIDENTTFDASDFRNTVPRFSPEARKANQALVDLLGNIAAQEKRDACADRARVAFGPEAVDRADSGNDEAASPERERRRGRRRTHRATISATSRPPPRTITVEGARYSEAAQRMINR